MANLDSQTWGLILNLCIGIPTVIICLLLFDVLRRRVPSVFEARRALNNARLKLDYFGNRVYSPPPPSYRLLGWLPPLMRIEMDTIAITHGLDTALFLRYLRTMAALFFLFCLPAVVLLPVFYTADHLETSSDADTVGVQNFSLSNVDPDDKWRFWVVLAMDYIVLIVTSYLIHREFHVYAKHRKNYRSSVNPANYTIIVQDIPEQTCSEHAIYDYWNNLLPNQIARVYFVRDGSKLITKHKKFWLAVKKRERAEWDLEFNEKLNGRRPTHKVGFCSCRQDASRDSINYWAEQQHHYANKIALHQQESGLHLSPSTRSAIVVFKTRRAASDAAQISFARTAGEWRVVRAPEPNAVNWGALSIPGWQTGIRTAVMIVASILLIIFWIIPLTFIMSLVNLQNLSELEIRGKQPFSFLDSVLGWNSALLGLIESLLPVIILSVFLSLIPTFFRIFVSISRVTSLAKVDMYVRDWYFTFVVFSNFLFVIVAGSLLEKLVEITRSPEKAAEFLASSAPKNGAFMMNFILLKALSETPQAILQIARVVVRWIILKYIARTTREKNDVETGSTTFSYLRYYAMAQLVALLGLIYSTISPFIIPIAFAYFAIMYIVWKYNLCFSMHNEYEDGGRMYGGALYSLWVSMFLHFVTMIGIFGVNGNPAQSILVILPAVFSVVFLFYCRRTFSRICEHGSVLETQIVMEEQNGADIISDELAVKYIHPGFEPLPDPIENLNGVNDKDGDRTPELHEDLEMGLIPGSGRKRDDQIPQNSVSSEEWKDAFGAGLANEDTVPP
ncbi:CSC1-like protein [Gracilariopsis chorda]|uniref:CSC1-like protein n=1 Tax=Gracilariopsis chorda TaxID=448386 RepID=A0A2V3J6G1_9FLOR|nr:CSC1-like protein [Gracilariopsis chorda]|eukprot:PXF49995.1 CSC1-like protein [Gracilariopsis chorda]